MTYWRMKKRVEGYKALVNIKSKEVPDELIDLEMQLKKMDAEIKAMKAKEEPEALIAEKVVERGVLRTRYRTAIKQFDSDE